VQDDGENAPPALMEALPEEKRWGSYIKLQSVWGDQDPGFNMAGYNSTSLGAQFGFDYRFAQNVTAGLAAGYVNTRLDVANNGGEMQEHSIRMGPYASYSQSNWYIDGSLTAGYHFYTNDRNISALGLVAESNFNGWDLTGYLGAGYHHDLGGHWLLTPNAALQYSYFSIDGFTESGAPSANLTVDARTSDSLKSRLGATISYVGLDWGAKIFPSAYLGWEHEYLEDSDFSAAFVGIGGPFLIDTGTRDSDALYLGLQMAVMFERNVTGFFRFEDARGSTSDVRGVSLGLTINF
jgi:outer membrane autotransporter protein